MSLDLRAHVALVTGSNHGIGAATALALAAHGAKVLVTYYRFESDDNMPDAYRQPRMATGEDVVSTIHAHGGIAVEVEANLSDPSTPVRLFEIAERELGPVDILVNNASAWLADTFTLNSEDLVGHRCSRVSADTFNRQFFVDARASALLIAEFARRHIRRGATWGRIIGLTSGGPQGFPGEVSYGAAKAAMDNYTMSAAFELARFGVTANVVCPPVTDTGCVTEKVRNHVRSRPEFIHIAEPEEVAQVVAYPASDMGKLITANVMQLR